MHVHESNCCDLAAKDASQAAQIYRYLLRGNSITAIEAQRLFGCARLAARIDELRNRGVNISSVPVRVINRQGRPVTVAEYRLVRVAGGAA